MGWCYVAVRQVQAVGGPGRLLGNGVEVEVIEGGPARLVGTEVEVIGEARGRLASASTIKSNTSVFCFTHKIEAPVDFYWHGATQLNRTTFNRNKQL